MKKILKYFLTASLLFNTVLTQLNSLTTQQDQLSSKTIEIGTALATSLDPQLGIKIKEDKLHALERVSHITSIAEERLKLKFDPQIYNSLLNLYASIYGSLSLAVEAISSQQDKLITFIETLYNYETKKQDQYPFRYPIVFALLTISKILATQEEGYQGPTYSQRQLSAFNNAIKNKFESVYNQEQKDLIKTTITKRKIQTLCNTLEQVLPLAPAWWNPLHWKPSTILTVAGIGCVISLTAAIIVLTINTNRNANQLVQTFTATAQTARDAIGTRQLNGQFPEGSFAQNISDISQTVNEIGLKKTGRAIRATLRQTRETLKHPLNLNPLTRQIEYKSSDSEDDDEASSPPQEEIPAENNEENGNNHEGFLGTVVNGIMGAASAVGHVFTLKNGNVNNNDTPPSPDNESPITNGIPGNFSMHDSYQ